MPTKSPLTDWLTTDSLHRAKSSAASEEIPTFCGTQKFITIFTLVPVWSHINQVQASSMSSYLLKKILIFVSLDIPLCGLVLHMGM